jgi:hypothetical protein
VTFVPEHGELICQSFVNLEHFLAASRLRIGQRAISNLYKIEQTLIPRLSQY